MGATPAGETVAIWGANYDEESGIEVASRPRKGSWGGAGRLATPGGFPQPQLAITPKGEAIGAWVKQVEEGFEAELQVATRKPGGRWKVKTFAPQPYADSPPIVTEPGGRAKVVWAEGDSFEKQEIVAATHSPGGGWTGPESLAAEGLQPPSGAILQLAVTGAGESIAVWSSRGSVGERVTIRASSKPRGQLWSEPTDLSTSPVVPIYGDPHLQVAVAPSGEAVALWRSFDGTGWVIQAAAHPPTGSP